MKAISFTQKRAEQFVRSDNMGFTVVFERINNPAPPIAHDGTCNSPLGFLYSALSQISSASAKAKDRMECEIRAKKGRINANQTITKDE